MTDALDWRLETREEEWMHGAVLERRTFTATPESDHAHCCLCWDKFMEPPHEALREGYLYAAPPWQEWVCELCFRDFEDHFAWTAVIPAS